MNAMDATLAPRAATDELVDATLRGGKTIWLHISTRSMLPTLAPGDRICARGLLANEARVGAIVLARTHEHWVAHRLIAWRGVGGKILWTTQGDNCPDPDDPWSTEEIYAIISAVERNGRIANLESGRARAAGAVIALLARIRSRAVGSHRAFEFALGAMMYASARIAQWIM